MLSLIMQQSCVSCDHVPAYCPQKLKVLFAVGSDGEVSEPLEVIALNCDTVEQVKEKILSTFKAKFGFPYNPNHRDIYIGENQTRFSQE